MAELPRYQRLGVRAAQPGELDFANLRESAKLGRTISEQVDRMASFVYKEEQMKAEQRGAQMAQTLGATETLTRIQEAGGPTTIAERSAYNVANRIASTEIETQARLTIDNILTQAEINKTPLPEVQSRLRSVVDGYPAALSPLDAQVAGVLRAQLFSVAAQAELRYTSIASKRVQEELQGKALQGIVQRQNDIYSFSRSDMDPAAREEALGFEVAGLETFMRDRQFSEAQISKTLIETRGQSSVETTISTFQRLTTLDQQRKFVEDLEKNPPPNITAEAARTLARSFQTEINNTLSTLKAERTDIKSDLSDLRTIMTKGGTPNPQSMAALESRASRLPPEIAGDLNGDIAQLKFIQSRTEVFRKMSPTQLQATINEMARGIDGLGGPGLDTLPEVEVLDAAKGLLNTMNTELNRDPLSWGANTGVIQFSPIDLSTPENAAVSVAQRISDARRVSAVYGNKPAFLTDEETRVLSTLLTDSPRPQRMALLSGLVKNFGTHSPQVLKQLSNVEPSLAHVGGLIVLGKAPTANMAMAGFDMIKEGNKAIGLDGVDAKEAFASSVGPALLYQSQSRAAGMEVAKAIYTKQAIDKGLAEYDDKLWQQSIQLAFGYDERTKTGGIAEVRGKMTLLSGGLDADKFEDILENMTIDQLKANTGFDDIDPGVAKSIKDNDRIYPVLESEGKYLLVYEKDGTINHFTDRKGNVIYLDIHKLLGTRK